MFGRKKSSKFIRYMASKHSDVEHEPGMKTLAADRLAALNDKFGYGIGAMKERAKLAKILNEQVQAMIDKTTKEEQH